MSYVPSEETLNQLGFVTQSRHALLVVGLRSQLRYSKVMNDFWIEDSYHSEGPQVYPKSDEELRLLISMMTP